MIKYWLFSCLLFVATVVEAQRLNSGFNLLEYQEMLRVNAYIYEQVVHSTMLPSQQCFVMLSKTNNDSF
ncbi:hypothetical protein D3C87_499340 [compost metagenome]|uniref:hypothetical protein n=1 Tax=Sphingobacterium TaxID=28453 RepID=UPI000FAF34D8|nr:hypothetical protein [Sphingobacterium sp. GVS05A]